LPSPRYRFIPIAGGIYRVIAAVLGLPAGMACIAGLISLVLAML
jgi:hypothetical protein